MRNIISATLIVFLLAGAALGGQPLSKKSSIDPEVIRKDLNRQAVRAFEENRWQDCLDLSKSYLETWPTVKIGMTEDIAFRIGVSHLNLDNLAEAGRHLTLVIKDLNHEYADAYAYRAVVNAKTGLLHQARADLLSAAGLGFDVFRFADNSNVEEISKLASDTAFMLEAFEKEKFDFEVLKHDPFVCPLSPEIDKKNDDGKKKGKLPSPEQKRLIEKGKRILSELRILMDELEPDEGDAPELEKKYAALKAIIAREKEFDAHLGELREIKTRAGRIVSDPLFNSVIRSHYVKEGEAILEEMLSRLNAGEYKEIDSLLQKLDRHTRSSRGIRFGEVSKWLVGEGEKISARAKKREKFASLDLKISGALLPEPGRQASYLKKLGQLELELDAAEKRPAENYSQKEVDSLRSRVDYYSEKVRPRSVIINNRVYEPGSIIFGQADLTLLRLNRDFAYFDFMGEKMHLNLPKVLSPVARKEKGE